MKIILVYCISSMSKEGAWPYWFKQVFPISRNGELEEFKLQFHQRNTYTVKSQAEFWKIYHVWLYVVLWNCPNLRPSHIPDFLQGIGFEDQLQNNENMGHNRVYLIPTFELEKNAISRCSAKGFCLPVRLIHL